jgi:hypothetical protein
MLSFIMLMNVAFSYRYAECHYFVLSCIMLCLIMLNVVILGAILGVIILNVVLLGVAAPLKVLQLFLDIFDKVC